jgi:hypothetical protein
MPERRRTAGWRDIGRRVVLTADINTRGGLKYPEGTRAVVSGMVRGDYELTIGEKGWVRKVPKAWLLFLDPENTPEAYDAKYRRPQTNGAM